jgi:hypothetical protein
MILLVALVLNFTESSYAVPAVKGEGNQITKVTTGRMTNIKETQAECTYKVDGTATEKGVCYSDTPSPTINHKKVTAPANAGSTVTSALPGLKAGTKYYVRAYAKNGAEVVYGNELNFSTLAKGEDSKPKAGPKVEPKPESPKK